MPIYNKLVRDHIPHIIEKTGKKYTAKTLDDGEYINALKNKSLEELQEYFNTENHAYAIEELADVLEIIHALARYHGASNDQLEDIRLQKAKKRGGFNDKIYLIEVED
ncbi:nucleoside triphosphate pyrophosphohydrolase [Cytobacillus purgationiresistens]|uniref:House-cleaning noncanonical NTP pyrophosphatase (MazG superfamily) n=1 Tax=Cytobacillus purgationiresistens TaxID=863449 RepID=A0ABU0ABS2_9BACI|nr:nucleoside triphosphate pyrophosphohydrolase [Cytobacillus purgationiresistens]MDQ0268237.1 putative house-cleaning noncanonical NTP pyrophosphatase (MazG superfamily) [Cytobacillus purgationiresistens]